MSYGFTLNGVVSRCVNRRSAWPGIQHSCYLSRTDWAAGFCSQQPNQRFETAGLDTSKDPQFFYARSIESRWIRVRFDVWMHAMTKPTLEVQD